MRLTGLEQPAVIAVQYNALVRRYDAMARDRDRWMAEAKRLSERLLSLEALITTLSDFAAVKERVS